MEGGVHVVALAIAPVKGLRLVARSEVVLGRAGVREDRRFYLVDARERMVNAKALGELEAVVADYDDGARRLALTFPDGAIVDGTVEHGEPVEARLYSRVRCDRLVGGPWSEALSAYAGQPLRLVEALGEAGAVDRGRGGAASLVSRGSLRRLEREAGATVDPRRFRMTIEVDGLEAHAEDAWVGAGEVRIGEAAVRFGGHVGRCLITSRDPDTGVVDLPTLDLLGAYRREVDATEPLPFGIWGAVTRPGIVRVGDAVLAARSRSVPGKDAGSVGCTRSRATEDAARRAAGASGR
jgi:uncharacterized protein YcbX